MQGKKKRGKRRVKPPVKSARKSKTKPKLTPRQLSALKGAATRKANARAKELARIALAAKRSIAAKNGHATRKRRALQRKSEQRNREKYKKPGRIVPGPKRPKSPASKSAAMNAVRRRGGRFIETRFYEESGYIHRIYEKGDYDPETFEVDPALIEAMIARELMEGRPGIYFATVTGLNDEGIRMERNTRPLPTELGTGIVESKRIAEIVELYELVSILSIYNNFIPERQYYDNTSRTERKNLRIIRSSRHRNVRKSARK